MTGNLTLKLGRDHLPLIVPGYAIGYAVQDVSNATQKRAYKITLFNFTKADRDAGRTVRSVLTGVIDAEDALAAKDATYAAREIKSISVSPSTHCVAEPDDVLSRVAREEEFALQCDDRGVWSAIDANAQKLNLLNALATVLKP